MKTPSATLLALLATLLAAPLAADDQIRASLRGFNEVPAIFSAGSGSFVATINEERTEIVYTLKYKDLQEDATQAHIHFGNVGTNGGIVLYLCSNLGTGPAGTPSCPDREGEVSGTLDIDSVVSQTPQGIDDTPKVLRNVIKSIRAGVTYVNVHSVRFPGGEIRGQVKLAED